MLKTLMLGGTFALIGGVLVSVGSPAQAFNFDDPYWRELGLNRTELHSQIAEFPRQHCEPSIRPLCERLSQGTLWFTGL